MQSEAPPSLNERSTVLLVSRHRGTAPRVLRVPFGVGKRKLGARSRIESFQSAICRIRKERGDKS